MENACTAPDVLQSRREIQHDLRIGESFMRKSWAMKLRSAAAAAIIMAVMPVAVSAAQECDSRAFNVQIDKTAQALRTLNRDAETRFQERLQTIGKAKGWTDAEKADRAEAAMDDRKLENFNAEIEELVGQLDALSATPKGEISCVRLKELKAVNDKLIAVMGQKSGFILAQLEVEAAKPPANTPTPPVAVGEKSDPLAPAKVKPPQQAPTEQPARPGGTWSVNVAQAPETPPAASPAVAPPARPVGPRPPRPAPSQSGDQVAALTPPPSDAPPIPANPAIGYTVQEIRDAGQGIFGTLTSEFAVVMNYAFRTYGQPNAYIVGDEGGGAFLAGIRYGDGKLYTRLGGADTGPSRIYWQGPSLGADVGATGSRTLFLVYNLNDVQTLYRRFPGLEGAAYVAGGFGLTVYRSGSTLIVPIRTGLGLRLGASIAYLKFTERASLNPF
jgi:hypothetical protein